MTQPGKLRAYGQNCPTVEVFPGPLIVRGSPPWNFGTITMGQMLIQLQPDYNIKVYVYCGNDNYQQPIWVPLGQHVPTNPNAVIPPNPNVKAAVSPGSSGTSSSAIKPVSEGTPTEHDPSSDNSKKDSHDDAKEEKNK